MDNFQNILKWETNRKFFVCTIVYATTRRYSGLINQVCGKQLREWHLLRRNVLHFNMTYSARREVSFGFLFRGVCAIISNYAHVSHYAQLAGYSWILKTLKLKRFFILCAKFWIKNFFFFSIKPLGAHKECVKLTRIEKALNDFNLFVPKHIYGP